MFFVKINRNKYIDGAEMRATLQIELVWELRTSQFVKIGVSESSQSEPSESKPSELRPHNPRVQNVHYVALVTNINIGINCTII